MLTNQPMAKRRRKKKRGKKYTPPQKVRTEEIVIGHKEKFRGIEHQTDGNIRVKLPSGDLATPDTMMSSIRYARDSGKDKVVVRLQGEGTFGCPWGASRPPGRASR